MNHNGLGKPELNVFISSALLFRKKTLYRNTSKEGE